MMDYIIKGTTLTDIADAIRSKNGTTSPILTEKMADAIRDISGGNADDSIVGTWKFNDEMTTFFDEITTYEEFDRFNNEGNSWHELIGYSYVEGEKSEFDTIYAYRINVENDSQLYHTVAGDSNDYAFYYEDDNWHIGQTITITEEPTDTEVIAWLKANATKIGGGSSSGASAYTVSSVDELPSDAVEGSMAIVESDSIKGSWQFDYDNSLDFGALNLANSTTTEIVIFGYADMIGVFGVMRFAVDGEGNTTLSIPLHDYEVLLYGDDFGWDDIFENVKFYEDIVSISTRDYDTNLIPVENSLTAENFAKWVKLNLVHISGGYSLYTYENGSWVYKCEIV